MNKKALILTLALALPASLTLAQRPGGPPPGGQPPRGFPPGPPPNQQPGGGNPGQPGGQPPPQGGGGQQPGKPPLVPAPLIRGLDADYDGIISAGEIEKAPDALTALDKNKDGKLMPDEFLAPQRFQPQPPGPPPGDNRERGGQNLRKREEGERPFPGQKPPRDGDRKPAGPGQQPAGPPNDQGEPPRPPAPPLVGALDADHNGVISAAEIADSAKSLLTLDKNNDGQLGPFEYGTRPPGQPPGDGPKPPPPAPEAE